MSTNTITRPPETRHSTPPSGVTFAGASASEWIKFRSLRSSWFTLSAALLGFLAISLIIAFNGRSGILAPEDSAASATSQGYMLAELLIGVLGVLFVSGEYGTGMIRSTLAAVPKRIPVLYAKAVVFGGIVFGSALVVSFVSFLTSQAILSTSHRGFSLTDPTALRVVIGVAVYLTLVGLLGSALGWIVRSTAGGISALVAVLLVLPVILQTLGGSWGASIGQFLPSAAGGSFLSSVRADHTLAPWTGLGVMALWVAAALLFAGWRLRHRDA